MVPGRRVLLLLLAVAITAPARSALAQAVAPLPAGEPPPVAPLYRPRTVIEVQAGRDFGTSSGDTRGDGLLFSAVGSLTPLWMEEKVGFGVGFGVGWKFNSPGGASFSRFPLSAFAHVLLRLHDRWFTLVRVGTVKLVSTTGSGTNGDVTSSWGAFADWGVCRWFEHQWGLALLLRYTHLALSSQGAAIDADSVGPALGVFFGD